MDSELPFVSCVCIAGKSRFHDEFMYPAALHWFRSQAYPADRRELVTVQDVGTPLVFHWDNNESLIRVGKQTLGGLRNVGLEHAHGDLIAQWDCDEIFHPLYLSTLVESAVANRGNPVFLQRELAYDFETDTACVRDLVSTFVHGSILHPKTDFRYPEIAKCEDTEFLKNWLQGTVISNDPMLKVHLSHGHNTWDRRHILRQYDGAWSLGKWHLCRQHGEYLERALTQYHLPPNSAHGEQDDNHDERNHAAAQAPSGLEVCAGHG